MCGIAGFCLNPEDHLDAKELSQALIDQIVVRGEHATGAAWIQRGKETHKPEIAVSKAPVPGKQFGPYLDQMSKRANRVILHTRWATQGSPMNNLNNHPIVSGRIVGAHNGILSNDRQIFANLAAERQAEVDSEAAFALLDAASAGDAGNKPADVLRTLKGRAALCWFNARDKRDLHLARVDGSPLAIGLTPRGSMLFASTLPLLVKAAENAKVELLWVEEIAEYTYMRIRGGEILSLEDIGESVKSWAQPTYRSA